MDDPEEVSKPELRPVDNDISIRDVEELSPEVTKKSSKPEKFTLFSSYLPVKDTPNDTDIDFSEFDLDDEGEKPREGTFIYIFELAASVFQLLWGGFLALFRPSSSS